MDFVVLVGVLALSVGVGLLGAGGTLTLVLYLMMRNGAPARPVLQRAALRDAVVPQIAA